MLVYLSDELIHLFFGEAIQHSHPSSAGLSHGHSHSHFENSTISDEHDPLIQQSTSYGTTGTAVKRFRNVLIYLPQS